MIRNKFIKKLRKKYQLGGLQMNRGYSNPLVDPYLTFGAKDIKTDLPLSYKLTHLHRKDMFSYNWQLNEDKTPFFIKYGYNWIFNRKSIRS